MFIVQPSAVLRVPMRSVRLAMQSTLAVLGRVWHIGVVMRVCGSGAWLVRLGRARGLCPGGYSAGVHSSCIYII